MMLSTTARTPSHAAIGLAAVQLNKQVHRGAEGSNFAECHDSLAQCLPAFLLRGTLAALAAPHRKAQFGARINHSAQVDAKFFGERQELGCSRIAVRYRLMAKLVFVCHRP